MRKHFAWPAVLLVVITIALWVSVGLNYRYRQEAVLLNWNYTQMALVKNIASASQGWLELRLGEGASRAQAAEEVFQRYLEPVHLLPNSAVWVYDRGQVLYNRSPDFPAEYQGLSVGQIFDLQKQKGASHYAELVQGVQNGTESSGWYIWLPATGRQFAAWTSTAVPGDTWTIGLSTPETEILAFSGSQGSLQRELFGASLITVLLWAAYFLFQRQVQMADVQAKMVESTSSDKTRLAQRVTNQTAELAQVNAELQKASTAKDEFLASVSHELRTPLSTVIGLAYALKCQVYGPVNEKQAGSLQTILTTTQHLSVLVNNILDLSKIQAGQMKLEIRPISTPALLDACLSFIDQQAYRKDIKVSLDRDPQVNTIDGDEARLKQALFNLLNNAIKFTPTGGQVGIEVKGDPQEKRVEITVWDTGIGIAPADFGRLFKPFVQLDTGIARQYGGTGLGLSLVERIAEMHGGSIAVSSEAGKGSRFTVALPWQGSDTQEPVEETAQILRTLEGIPRPEQAWKIMIVEEEGQKSQLMADFLTAAGYEVILAAGGKNALSLCKERLPHLVMVNLRLTDMDGFEVIRRLRSDEETASIPVVAVNSLILPGDEEAALRAGAATYLKKPLRLDRLAVLLPTLLRKADSP